MFVSQLEVKNFRNISDINIDPCNGVNIIYGELAEEVIIRHESGAYAIVPAGTKLADGVTELKFSGKGVDSTGNFDDETKSYDIHIEGIADDNTKCIKVFIGAILDKNLGDTELKLYHEDVQMTRVDSVEDFAINNQFTYDPTTGAVVLYVDNFSIFSGLKTSADVWDGEAKAEHGKEHADLTADSNARKAAAADKLSDDYHIDQSIDYLQQVRQHKGVCKSKQLPNNVARGHVIYHRIFFCHIRSPFRRRRSITEHIHL